jgi:DNA polymerase III epsilon subunit-like protein
MVQSVGEVSNKIAESFKNSKPLLPPCTPDHIVALDCEMVGCGSKGRISALGRCSIVNYHGEIIYDSFVKPILPVTDYRTKWSGIKRKHLSTAVPFSEAKKLIKRHLSGKYIVGHDLKNDFSALKFSPHPLLVKDTSKCLALRHIAGLPEQQKPSLRNLTGW